MPQTKQQTHFCNLCGGDHNPDLWCANCTAICLSMDSCKNCPKYKEDDDCDMSLDLNNWAIE